MAIVADKVTANPNVKVGEVILDVKDLKKHFLVRRGFFASLKGGPNPVLKAVDGVSFQIRKGEIYGVVGESGCGKTTMARTLLKLTEPTDGEMWFEGTDIAKLGHAETKVLRRHMQMVFQDPYESMNPRLNVSYIVSEPLRIQNVAKDVDEALPRVLQCLEDVEMTPVEEYIGRFPHELSGGQRQRIAVARALALDPSFIVADEPVSMLDVSIRGEVLNLMQNLCREKGVTFVYITHDLATARHICDRIAVMYLGRMVEEGTADDIVGDSLHPYTQALINAVFVPDPNKKQLGQVLKGEVPNPINPPKGCRLHPRCPKFMDGVCNVTEPELVEIKPGHRVACHLLKNN